MSSLGDADAILRGRTQTGKSKKNEKEADPSTSYICHICATDVPAAFSGAHNASKTHRANASIMAAASERMRAMVTARPPPRTPRPVGTYCAVCNTMADGDHKKTGTHRQAVRDEQLLSMLANLYCGGDDDNDDNIDDDDDDSADEISKSQEDINNTTNAASQIDIEGAVHDDSPDKLSKSQDIEKNKQHNHIKLNNTTNMARLNIERANDDDGDDDSSNKLSGIHDKATNVINQIDIDRAVEDNDDDDSPDKKRQVFLKLFGTSPFESYLELNQQTEHEVNNETKQASGVISDPYDPKHDLFWSLVKGFRIEQPWRTRFITIHPAGSKIQIYVDKEKVNVPYDNFHSFNRKEGKCLICMEYFDAYYGNEAHHIATKQHMSRIMLPVKDSDCFRKIAEWFHCILCNDTFHINSEEQHKTSADHCKNKMEATAPSDHKSRTSTINVDSHPNLYERQNVKVQYYSSKNTETRPRKKITLQKQTTEDGVECTRGVQ
ncbi:uncharacterized protein [Choristoneura fumiferana]|uniref:uncharacterized protein n=1 Tax=Choristoneura fumiferana TaxID=7141 RepID=UPI003D158D29